MAIELSTLIRMTPTGESYSMWIGTFHNGESFTINGRRTGSHIVERGGQLNSGEMFRAAMLDTTEGDKVTVEAFDDCLFLEPGRKIHYLFFYNTKKPFLLATGSTVEPAGHFAAAQALYSEDAEEINNEQMELIGQTLDIINTMEDTRRLPLIFVTEFCKVYTNYTEIVEAGRYVL